MPFRKLYCSTNIYNKLENECKYEPGGYFIVNGGEKVIVSLEIMAVNKTLVYSKKDLTYEDGKYFSAQINSRVNDWSDNFTVIINSHNACSFITLFDFVWAFRSTTAGCCTL